MTDTQKAIDKIIENRNDELDYAKGQTRVALYCRTSMKSQHLDLQYKDLVETAKRMDWKIVELYEEQVSGTKLNIVFSATSLAIGKGCRWKPWRS